MFDIETHLQTESARHLQWLIDGISVENGRLEIFGWALMLFHEASDAKILLNGKPFQSALWHEGNPDLDAFWDKLPKGTARRFRCFQEFTELDAIFPDGFARFSVVLGGAAHSRTYRSTWSFPDPRSPTPLPDGDRIQRVIGVADVTSYLTGGATAFNRIDGYLAERFGKRVSEFKSVLDWGCGSGRVTRHLMGLPRTRVTGVDIDADNIRWCQANMPSGQFVTGPLSPPMPLPDGSFDLAIGNSVFTHLAEDQQFLWLEELRRVTRSGAILLMSIHGASIMALYKFRSEMYVEMERKGFLHYARNADLDAVMDIKDYYRDVAHSHDYVFANWSKYFEILDIVPSLASNQDLVVMRVPE